MISPVSQGVAEAVQRRYTAAALRPEPGLCCPVPVDEALLAPIPASVLERDYGCGDPVSRLRPGETVLDLGCGAGKMCFVAAQLVGPSGRVLGVDANQEMLALARAAQGEVADRLGYRNVSFLRGRIEDLALDLDFVDDYLAHHPVAGLVGLAEWERYCDRLRAGSPLIAGSSVDVVISNCVLNLVEQRQKRRMFDELARVLRPGGRAVISDIVADREVPRQVSADAALWSGCVSGAFEQSAFFAGFALAGLHGLTVLKRDGAPWRVIDGVEFRSITVLAYKAPAKSQADPSAGRGVVMYAGPFASVTTDSGRVFARGEPISVGAAELAVLEAAPHGDHFRLVEVSGAEARDADAIDREENP